MFFTKTMILMSILSMCWWRKTLIPLLLSLEFFLISIFTILIINSSITMYPQIIIMLMIMVSGSSMGLAMMVSLSRNFNKPMSSSIWTLMFDKNHYSLHSNNKNST